MSKINFQALLDVVRATEIQYTDKFDMNCIFQMDYGFCGTAGCMIGNYNLMKGLTGCLRSVTFSEHAKEFGVTKNEFDWLFDAGVFTRVIDANGARDIWVRFRRDLEEVTKEEALSRLRKFIYYKLHKQEMIYDDRGCVRESARQAEGNHMFAKKAVESSKNLAMAVGE